MSNAEGLSSVTYETSSSEYYTNNSSLNRSDRNKFSSSYGTVTVNDKIVSDMVLETNSLEETDRCLERTVDVYKDPSPQIIRRGTLDSPVTYEQRVFVRYLRSPKLPPPGVRKQKQNIYKFYLMKLCMLLAPYY